MGINVGTSGRSKCGSIGLEKYQSVVLANGMAERTGWVLIIELQNFYSLCFGIKVSILVRSWRTALLCLLISCLFGCWVVEQPNSSVLEYYPPFRYMMNAHIASHGLGAVALPN